MNSRAPSEQRSVRQSMESARADGPLQKFSFSRHVEADELSQPRRLLALWAEAYDAELVGDSENERREFFALAHYCRRAKCKSPVGLMCGLLDGTALRRAKHKRPWRSRIAGEDEEWARQAMKRLRDGN